ncbi:MAG TPA: hypothetical protein VKE98_03255 [Gemmataceae bacterium]|nr:hypothetical protein [Gemmataceae bacterium]
MPAFPFFRQGWPFLIGGPYHDSTADSCPQPSDSGDSGQAQRSRRAVQAILKEFGEAANGLWKATTDDQRKQAAARVEPLPLKFLQLAEKNPKEPWTLDALTQVINQEYWLDNYSSHAGWGKDSRQARALAILLRDHLQSDKLGGPCWRAQYGFPPSRVERRCRSSPCRLSRAERV